MNKELIYQAIQAIDHLCKNTTAHPDYDPQIVGKACAALEKALAEPDQKPVAELRQDMKGGGYVHWLSDQVFDEGTTLYTAPTPRKPLTDEELEPLLDEVESYDSTNYDLVKFARAIERAHGIGEQHE